MSDLLNILGGVQSGGGILLGLLYLAYEVRTIRHDFGKHEEIYEHKPKRA